MHNRRFSAIAIALAILFASALPAQAKRHSYTNDRKCLTYSAQALLARIEDRFGRVQVVSTCRPGARVRGTRKLSLHSSGNAIDFVAGSRKREIVAWLIRNHNGGVMTYARSRHIHVDVGRRFVKLGHGSKRKKRRIR